MSKQKVIICQDLGSDLAEAIALCPHDKLFILVDEHTQELCLPLLSNFNCLKKAETIIIGAGDVHKNIETLASVWQELGNRGATRHSLMINLGGGMVTDLGGFAASTFKRGIRYINIPTIDRHTISEVIRHTEPALRLCRDAETRHHQHHGALG